MLGGQSMPGEPCTPQLAPLSSSWTDMGLPTRWQRASRAWVSSSPASHMQSATGRGEKTRTPSKGPPPAPLA